MKRAFLFVNLFVLTAAHVYASGLVLQKSSEIVYALEFYRFVQKASNLTKPCYKQGRDNTACLCKHEDVVNSYRSLGAEIKEKYPDWLTYDVLLFNNYKRKTVKLKTSFIKNALTTPLNCPSNNKNKDASSPRQKSFNKSNSNEIQIKFRKNELLKDAFTDDVTIKLTKKVEHLESRIKIDYQRLSNRITDKGIREDFHKLHIERLQYKTNVCHFETKIKSFSRKTPKQVELACRHREAKRYYNDLGQYALFMLPSRNPRTSFFVDSKDGKVRIIPEQGSNPLDTFDVKIIQQKETNEKLRDIKPNIKQNRKTSVEMIGVYEGDYPKGVRHSYSYQPEGKVKINVKNNPNIESYILILTSYEPVNWEISLEEYTKIEKIYLSSYHPSRVTGIKNISVIRKKIDMVYKGLNTRVRKQIKALTGKDVDQFQGGYQGSEFNVF